MYFYLLLFIICIYLVYCFNDKSRSKLPKAYSKFDLQYYPVNYNCNTYENKYVTCLKNELMLYNIVLKHLKSLLTPFSFSNIFSKLKTNFFQG